VTAQGDGEAEAAASWVPVEFERYMLLLERIEREPKYTTAPELLAELTANGYPVNIRTVQRVLGYFERRFGLVSRTRDAPGRPKEWAWPRNRGGLVVPDMDPPTALTYRLAVELLAPLLPPSFLAKLEPDLRRARQVLRQVGTPGRRLPDKVRLLPRGGGRLPANVNERVLTPLYDALLGERRVLADYRGTNNPSPRGSRYELSPLALVFRFDTLYLVHVAEPRRPERDPDRVMEWPLHRFIRVEALDTPIRVPPGFDLDAHLRAAGFLQNRHLELLRDLGPEIALKAKFRPTTATYIAERGFSADQRLTTLEDGRVLVEATVPNTRELLTELHDFAGDVEIIAPPALRAYFHALTAELLDYYGEDEPWDA